MPFLDSELYFKFDEIYQKLFWIVKTKLHLISS
jgi:hypothetical protein